MTDITINQTGAATASGNLRPLNGKVPANRQRLPYVYTGLISGQSYLYNVNLWGSAGNTVTFTFVNADPPTYTKVLEGDSGGTARDHDEILITAL